MRSARLVIGNPREPHGGARVSQSRRSARGKAIFRAISFSAQPLLLVACALSFLSGAAALIYQLLWIRSFAQLLGNTYQSSGIVIASFLLGLGLGAFLAGRLADQLLRLRTGRRGLWLALAACELFVAAWALLLSRLPATLEPMVASLTRYAAGPEGWLQLSWSSLARHYAISQLLLLPPAIAMGASLPFLVRLLGQLGMQRIGPLSAAAYSWNTLGAAIGCLACEVWLVPRLGLRGAHLAAIGCNAVAALLALSRCNSKGPESGAEPVRSGPGPGWLRPGPLLAVFCSGAAALGLEQIWLRFLLSGTGLNRTALGLTLASVLFGLFAGALALSRLPGGGERGRGWFALAQGGVAAGCLLSLHLFDLDFFFPLSFFAGEISQGSSYGAELLRLALATGTLCLPASFFMGAALPALHASVQSEHDPLGFRAGQLLAANTAGAITGTLFVALLAIPAFGLRLSLAACLLLIGLAILFSCARHRSAWLLLCCAFLGWITLPESSLRARSFLGKGQRGQLLQAPYLIDHSEGPGESAMVVEYPEDGSRVLLVSGRPMAGDADNVRRYMRALGYYPAFFSFAPRRALLLGFGIGNTLAALTALESLEEIQVVESSRHLLGKAELFPKAHGGSWRDPRISYYINDARSHLLWPEAGHFDLITSEPPAPGESGAAALYSIEFFRMVRARLSGTGVFAQWLPMHRSGAAELLKIVKSFVEAFPEATLLAGDYGDFLLLGTGSGIRPQLDPGRFLQWLAENPRARSDLEGHRLSTLLDFAGSFLAGPDALRKATAEITPLSDSYPSPEYERLLSLSGSVPGTLIAPEQWREFCDRCPVASHETYARTLRAIYGHPDFLRFSTLRHWKTRRLSVPLPAGDRPVLSASPYLSRLGRSIEFRFVSVPNAGPKGEALKY